MRGLDGRKVGLLEGGAVHVDRVVGVRTRVSKGHPVLLVEGAGELVGIHQVEHPPVHLDLGPDGKVVRGVVRAAVRLCRAVPLDEDALGDARVVLLGLRDVHRVVLEVVVEDHLECGGRAGLGGAATHGLACTPIEMRATRWLPASPSGP